MRPKHILVIRFSAMGDVAMTVPVLRAFSKQYPEIALTILTRKSFAPFFKDIPNLIFKNADLQGKHKGIVGLYRLAQELKELKFDAVVDLHDVLRSNILKLFMRGTSYVQVDKGRAEKKALISGKIFKQLKSTHQRYADVFNALGFKMDLSDPSFPKTKVLSEPVMQLLGNKTEKWIGIAPFAQYESKMYSLESMQEVIGHLASENRILLFGGGAKEVAQLEEIQNKNDGVFNIAGKFSLEEEIAVISNLDIMLSMDSGNGHIAAMLGKKVVTLWGVTHPFAGFYPFNQDVDCAILTDRERFPLIPTSVYGNRYPADYKDAISTIPPKEVIQKVEELLK